MADKRGNDPIEYSKNHVELEGEELGPILWRGRQWAVTEYGIERLNGRYVIEKGRLAEGLGAPDFGGWPAHVTEKVWVDADEFCTAYLVALALHGYASTQPREEMANLVRAAIANGRVRG